MAVLVIGERSFWSWRNSASSVVVWSEVSAGGAGTRSSLPEASTQVFHCPTCGPSLATSPRAESAVTPRSARVITTHLMECHCHVHMIVLLFLSCDMREYSAKGAILFPA